MQRNDILFPHHILKEFLRILTMSPADKIVLGFG